MDWSVREDLPPAESTEMFENTLLWLILEQPSNQTLAFPQVLVRLSDSATFSGLKVFRKPVEFELMVRH